jgi:hypothetical protein
MATRADWIKVIQRLAVDERQANPDPPFLETRMADDPKKTGLDRKLISLTEEHEVRSWTESLGCTEEQLRAAVKAVGNSAEKVREYLGKK